MVLGRYGIDIKDGLTGKFGPDLIWLIDACDHQSEGVIIQGLDMFILIDLLCLANT